MAKGDSEVSLLDAPVQETSLRESSTAAGPSAPPGDNIIAIHPSTDDNKLLVFQLGVGLPGAARSSGSFSNITTSNRGVYPEVCAAEAWARFSFYFYDYLLSLCVSGQIVVGATLTALGASNSNYTLISVLSAANTAMAATIALLKGQGLPNRPRQDWNAWSNVRAHIEEREREIAASVLDGGSDFNIQKEVRIIQDMFRETKISVERNRPDVYNTVAAADGGAAASSRIGVGKGVSHNI